jgi:hypothetical protein
MINAKTKITTKTFIEHSLKETWKPWKSDPGDLCLWTLSRWSNSWQLRTTIQ